MMCVFHGTYVEVRVQPLESVLSAFTWELGMELGLLGLHGECLYLLSHPADPEALHVDVQLTCLFFCCSCFGITAKKCIGYRLQAKRTGCGVSALAL